MADISHHPEDRDRIAEPRNPTHSKLAAFRVRRHGRVLFRTIKVPARGVALAGNRERDASDVALLSQR